MHKVNKEEATKEIIAELEIVLGKLVVATDSGISTYNLGQSAQGLVSKVRAFGGILSEAELYMDVLTDDRIYNPEERLSAGEFMAYCSLCKKAGSALDVYRHQKRLFACISSKLFIALDELPSAELPKFMVNVAGSKLRVVQADLLAKLPQKIRELLR